MGQAAARTRSDPQDQAAAASDARTQRRALRRIVAKAQMEAEAAAATIAARRRTEAANQAGPAPAAAAARKRTGREMLWRLLAAAMAIEIGWWIWVAVQLHQPQLALPAAFEAAAARFAVRDPAQAPQ
jgi:hypothetical protein